MKIKKLQLKNGYKRFHDLTIDLGDELKRIIALVGLNGCGKSSVLDGLLFRHNSYTMIGSKDKKGFEYHSLNNTPNYNYQNVIIEFLEGDYGIVYEQRKKQVEKTQFFHLARLYPI